MELPEDLKKELKKAIRELDAAYKRIDKYCVIKPLNNNEVPMRMPFEEMKRDFDNFDKAKTNYWNLTKKLNARGFLA
jgi:hypothetical protein